MAHPPQPPDVFATLAGIWFLAMFAGAFLIGVFWPIMALVVTLNIRGIRKELRTIAEQLELPSRRL